MNRFEALRIFCVTAESANFRAAAIRMGVSPQVITRVIRELEAEFGEPLFHRSTRGVRLTDVGEQLASKSAAAIAGIDEIFAHGAARAPRELAGIVRIAAPTAVGRRVITPGLAPLLASYPGLVVDLRLSEVLADVVDEQIDIGVRIGPMRDSSHVARPVSGASLVIVGSPELVARSGEPKDRAALEKAPLTMLIDRNTGRPWPWLLDGTEPFIPSNPVFITDDPEAECEAVLAGMGFGQLPGHLANPLLHEKRLVEVLETVRPRPTVMYVYRPHRTPVPARVRIIFDALCQLLQDHEETRSDFGTSASQRGNEAPG
ncbi:LysR family transcriptional regulator [Paraburkholderia sp. SARCC-3016]|uniref:LysR family transcriptional regulator n=1 Tax=Paraburkholderia sp. SARCC-3016 TaxID=3058611 RepID=UPI00280738F6|nr:LysR family transcriptional regulator [Paraburkholderia sp. SARCC-3016]MDQ7982090.1 LysR family transcriptional regulator [Paraburkholderia sp. SARCC-3016]